MKRKTLIHASIAVSAMAFMVAGTLLGLKAFDKVEKTDASSYSVNSVPTTIDCNDASSSTIRNYYSSLNNLSSSERQGTNLLKNLKPILKNGQKYYSYGSGATTAVWQVYEIVDRDWEKSPATAISGYDASTKIITGYKYGKSGSDTGMNPYLHALYVNRNVTNQTQAWGNHNQDQWGINQEHVWPKAEGFDDTSKGCGARGDIMHLWAGNGKVNGTYHSNYYYGYVDKSKTYNDASSYASTLSGNLKGYSKTFGGSTTVFEPQDSDKGDIARAIFYMVARYNYYSGSDSDGIDAGNPNLILTQSLSDWTNTGYTCTTTNPGKMGVLQDLLEWNRLDPPDEWEIHRNNLCYNNFTKNRNPFIDFPEWAEYIWGKSTSGSYSSNPTGYAIPSNDNINQFGNAVTTPTITLNKTSATLAVNGTVQLTATALGGSGNVTWTTSNSSRATISASTGNTITVTGKATGSATITASYSGVTATCSITVSATAPTVTSVTVSPATLELDLNGTKTSNLSATVTGTNSPAQTVTWSSSNTSVATVTSAGVVTAVAKGTATITATSTVDDTKSGTCAVTVIKSSSGGTGHWETSSTPYRKVLFGPTYNSASINSYSNTWSATNSDNATSTSFTVDITNANNNNNGWSYIRMGHKKTAYTSTITTASAVDQPIGKVDLNISGLTNPSCVTSVKLQYDDNATFASPEELSYTIATGTQSVTIEEPEENLYYRIEVVCTDNGNTGSNGHIQLTEIDYYNSTFIADGAATVTSVTVNPSSLNLDLNGNYTANLAATVVGEDDPDTTVTWSSSNTAIATVTSAGVVTALTKGNVTITATSTVDITKSGACDVVIIDSSSTISGASLTQGSPYINGLAYKMFFYNTQTLEARYFNGNKPTYYGSTVTAINDGVDVFFEANGATGQNIYFMKDGAKNYLYVVQSDSYYNFAFSTDVPSTAWYYRESGNDYACMTYTLNSTLFTFGASGTNVSIGTLNLGTTTDGYEIEFVSVNPDAPIAFSQLFLSSIVCNAQGTSAPTFATGISWNQFSKIYSKLDFALQSVLETATANENGTIIEQAVARYDYLLNKYGTDNYVNFLNREVGSSSKVLGKIVVTNNAVLLLVVMATLGTFTFAAWFIHKKKQYDL